MAGEGRAAGVAALIALLVALLLSRRITAPVESLIETARARGRGELGARAGDVRGLGEIQELAEASMRWPTRSGRPGAGAPQPGRRRRA